MMPRAGGLDLIVDVISCPLCQSRVTRTDSRLMCRCQHSFDIARQGYVSLFTGGSRANTGDSAEMVAARERFLQSGHYAPIADAMADAVADVLGEAPGAPSSEIVVDLAGGTGYYLARLLHRHPHLIGASIDLSSAASRRAARAHERMAAIAADVWQRLPLMDDSCHIALSVFGPRNGSEIARVLRADGALVVASPTPNHLAELIAPLGLIAVDPRKRERLDERLAGLARAYTRKVEYQAQISRADVSDEVAMGPSSHHLDAIATARRLSGMDEVTAVTISVEISVWAKTTSPGADESHNVSS